MNEDEKDIRNAIENPKYKPQRVAPRKGKIILSFIEPLSISVYSIESSSEISLIHLSIENKHPINDLILFSVNLSMNTTARDFDGDTLRIGMRGTGSHKFLIFLFSYFYFYFYFLFYLFGF